MINKTGKFKSKGANILKGQQRPKSMDEFIKDPTGPQERTEKYLGLHNSIETQNHINTSEHIHKGAKNQNEEMERIHCHIRKDLNNKILDEVDRRKRLPKSKRKGANKRAIIEEALEGYFA